VKTNGVLLKNHQIHDIVAQILPSYVTVIMVCGRHGHCLWPSKRPSVVCGRQCRTPPINVHCMDAHSHKPLWPGGA